MALPTWPVAPRTSARRGGLPPSLEVVTAGAGSTQQR